MDKQLGDVKVFTVYYRKVIKIEVKCVYTDRKGSVTGLA